MDLDAAISPPPFGAAFSVLLVAGCDALGLTLARGIFSFAREGDPAWQRWQTAVVGAMVLSALFYPLALFGLTPYPVLLGAAAVLAPAGAVHLWRGRERIAAMRRFLGRLWRDGSSFDRVAVTLVLSVLVGLGRTALGPVTNADALDYHIGVALGVLRHGGMPVHPEWFHARLAAGGEVLNALGLAVGAEAFGAFLQYTGLLAVTALLWGIAHESAAFPQEAQRRGLLLALAAVAAPVLLFLASAPKPQLLYQAMTTLALGISMAPSRRISVEISPLRDFALICLLALTAAVAKLSFLLTGGAVVLLALAVLSRRARMTRALLLAIACGALVVLPPVLWKMLRFDVGPFEALLVPLPGSWPGGDVFAAYLRAYTDSSVPFPLSLVLPGSAGTITTILGVGPFVVFGLRLRAGRHSWLVLVVTLIVAVLGALVSQRTSRFFVDTYFWLLLACAVALPPGFRIGLPRWLLAAQGAGMAALCWFGAVTLFPGALSSEWRRSVMQRAANGYDVMAWADTVLPADAVFLSEHRSLALARRPAVAYDWVPRAGEDSASWRPYLQLLKQRGVTHLLRFGDSESSDLFRECLGTIVAGPKNVKTATRNPFNTARRDAYLFTFHGERLPDCALASLDGSNGRVPRPR